jgi:hypothetical protein
MTTVQAADNAPPATPGEPLEPAAPQRFRILRRIIAWIGDGDELSDDEKAW